MKGQVVQSPRIGGLTLAQPQPLEGASVAENLAVDGDTLGWSTRVGYERYRTLISAGFAPFGTLGRIDSLFVYNQVAGGARQHILLEADGNLYLFYEANGAVPQLLLLRSSRAKPAATEPCTQYVVYRDFVVLTNGYDAPLILRPWPIGDSSEATTVAANQLLLRPLGWQAAPRAPEPLRVEASYGTSTSDYRGGGDILSVWLPATPNNTHPAGLGGTAGIGYSSYKSAGPPIVPRDNEFAYSCSFVSDTGSVSPLSAPAEVAWTQSGLPATPYYYGVGLRLPLGPPGTVARLVYRSLNHAPDAPAEGDTSRYFCLQVRNNVDELVLDTYRILGASEPEPFESVPMPAPRARFAAVYRDCLFLDGGVPEPTTLFYSQAGRPEQFRADGYVRLSNSTGGVTALFGFYTALLVFREGGIDVLLGDPETGFQTTALSNQVSCRSPNTIDMVPGVGVVFLAVDGVYAVRGGLEGGSQFEVVRLSSGLEPLMRRATPDCLPRAVGRYCPLSREYHVYFPGDGQDRPTLGLVWHIEKAAFSQRVGFPVGALDRLYSGELVFGHHTGAEGAQQGQNPPAGLFVLSARRAMGGTVVVQQGETVFTYGNPPVSRWRSPWLDMGDPQVQKQPQYVTLWVMTTGNVNVVLRHFKDFQRVPTVERAYLAQPPDTTALPVLDSAVVGATVWEDSRLVPLRIAVASMSCSWFAFEVETTDDLVLVRWEVEFVARGTRTVEGQRA